MDLDAGDALSYRATLADGSALPAWLQFDAARLQFTATPQADDGGQLLVRVTATDAAGASVQGGFSLTVTAPSAATTVSAAAAAPVPAPQEPVAAPLAVAAKAEVGPAAAVPVLPAPLPAAPGPAPLADAPAASSAVQGPRAGAVVEPPALTRPSARSDAMWVAAELPLYANLAATPLTQLLRSEELQRNLDEFRRQLAQSSEARSSALASSIAVTGGLSVGYVVWLVRGGVLVSSLLSALPAWQLIDPMPVLAASGAAKRRRSQAGHDEPDIERLFDGPAPATPAIALTPPRVPAPPVPAPAAVGAQKIKELQP